MKLHEAGIIVVVTIMALVVGAHAVSKRVREFSIRQKQKLHASHQESKKVKPLDNDQVHYHVSPEKKN